MFTAKTIAADRFALGQRFHVGIRREISPPVGAAYAAAKCLNGEMTGVSGAASERRMQMKNPCLNCQRVRNPQTCESKVCKDWQAWFIATWESMREHVRKQMEESITVEIGVPVGGERYAHPHRVRKYLQVDPCKTCLCPKELCHMPCTARMTWAVKNGEVRK